MENLKELAREAAIRHGLDPGIVSALIQKESSWNQWAWNPEPRYRWIWDVKQGKPFRVLDDTEVTSKVPPKDFLSLAGDRDQEWWAQQASWGLMQIMGAVARERGFSGLYLPEILDPKINLEIGCSHLQKKLDHAKGNIHSALLSWNGGGNQNYAEEVLALV